jgi:hypothetical protein
MACGEAGGVITTPKIGKPRKRQSAEARPKKPAAAAHRRLRRLGCNQLKASAICSSCGVEMASGCGVKAAATRLAICVWLAASKISKAEKRNENHRKAERRKKINARK